MARVIAYLICGGFAVMFLYVGATQFVQQRRNLERAERVDATIIRSTVTSSTIRDTDPGDGSSNNTTSHTPQVRFRYRVGGQQYESERLYPTIIEQGYASYESAADVLAPFPVNATVRAWVDPSRPEQAFLLGEKSNGPIVFIVLGFVMPVIGWLIGKVL